VFGVNDGGRASSRRCARSRRCLIRMLARCCGRKSASTRPTRVALVGTILFAAFVTLVMFDLLLLLCRWSAMIGVLARCARRNARAASCGSGRHRLGVLAKGR
jgi:hypothetical protein